MPRIETWAIFRNRDGNGRSYFHPRATVMPRPGGLFMTIQEITGSDVFHHVLESRSMDDGKTWSQPQPIPGFGRRRCSGDKEEGVCDVVPEFDAPSNTVLAMGHNVYYQADGKLFDSLGDWSGDMSSRLQRKVVYQIRDAGGEWLPERRVLDYSYFDDCAIYTCGCAQRVRRDDGTLLIPVSYAPWGRRDRSVTVLSCDYDGKAVSARKHGTIFSLKAGRGLLEPSLAEFDGLIYLTMRAEDERGYVSVGGDGLTYAPEQPWCWEDGEPLTMSTTQQRWLVHHGRLYLVYTRRSAENDYVMRWRAPLYLAEVNPQTIRLKRKTEQIVFPLSGTTPQDTARMGNFHATPIDAKRSIITVGEILPEMNWRGDTLLAYLTE